MESTGLFYDGVNPICNPDDWTTMA